MLSTKNYPAVPEILKLVADFQFPHLRDQLMADFPGIDEQPEHVLFALTNTGPSWSRIEWAKDLLPHTYIRTSPEHAAPILTTIGYINWWEGRGSKAHQYLQLALDTARLPLRTPHRPHARRRHHRRLEHHQKHGLPQQRRHAVTPRQGGVNRFSVRSSLRSDAVPVRRIVQMRRLSAAIGTPLSRRAVEDIVGTSAAHRTG
ncbi:hypothetical protein [Paenarthrobacter sp. NPDC057981]|uniref:hypothetical protein n=1 Tax=Paenarthrobacter sp. NPDC057981 TaxID=3346297 RepID=UPI0036D7C3FD